MTIELAKVLESNERNGAVAFIDGSPQYIQRISHALLPNPSSENIQNIILLSCIRILKAEEYAEQSVNILSKPNWEAKLQCFVDFAKTKSHYSENYGRKKVTSLIRALKISLNADTFKYRVLDRTPTFLFKAKLSSVKDINDDYGLEIYTKIKIRVESIEGDHLSILTSKKLHDNLNTLI